MESESLCRTHGWFDSHWRNYPERDVIEAIIKPTCPDCKVKAVKTITDESIELGG